MHLKTIRKSVALVGLLLLATAAGASANMLVNPGFDDNGGSFDGWIVFGNSFVTVPGEPVLSAPAAGKMFGLFNGEFNVSGILQAFPAVGGDDFTFTGNSFVWSADPMIGGGPPNSNWAVMKIAFFDAASGGNEIGGNEVIIASGLSPVDTWMFNTVSATAPAGTQRVEALFLYLQPAGVFDGGACFVDDATFDLNTPVSVEPESWGSVKSLYR